MNITKALTLALKVAAKRASIPVLNCARVSITDGTLALSATDTDIKNIQIYPRMA